MNVSPDGIIGHSLGEVASGYADGVLTREQAMKLAYFRGKVIMDNAEKVRGSMAVVALPWNEAKLRCLEGVFPVCNNGAKSVTISGNSNNVRLSI